MADGTPRIGLFGTFDLKNYGDLLFPDVFRHGIRKFLPGAEVVLFSPVGGVKPFSRGETVHPLLDLDRIHAEKPLSAIVVGGGELVRLDDAIVSDRRRYDYPGSPADLWAAPVLFGHAHGIPVLFNAPGVSFDFAPEVERPVVDVLKRVCYLSVRDGPSRDALIRMDPDLDVSVVPDTVTLYPDCVSPAEEEKAFRSVLSKTDLPPEYALFQINRFERGLSASGYVSALERIEAAAGCPVVLFPIGYVHRDAELLGQVEAASNGRFRMVRPELSPEEMHAAIGRARCFVGTSMHGCTTAMMHGVPAVGINWGNAKKMRGCFELYGMSPNLVRSVAAFSGEMLERTPPSAVVDGLKRRILDHFRTLAGWISSPPESVRMPDGDMALYESLLSSLRSVLPLRGSVYFDLGDGFSEGNSVSVDIEWNGRSFACEADVLVPPGCRRLRVDPTERPDVVLDGASVVAANGSALPVSGTNGIPVGSKLVFPAGDPWISVDLPADCPKAAIRLRGGFASPADVAAALSSVQKRERELSADVARARAANAKLADGNSKFRERNAKLSDENSKLRERNARLADENSKFRERNAGLADENSKVRARNAGLADENSKVRARNAGLADEMSRLRTRNQAVQDESVLRRDYIRKLSGQLGESRGRVASLARELVASQEKAASSDRKADGLSERLSVLSGEAERMRATIARLKAENAGLLSSATWRIGRFATWIPRRLAAVFGLRPRKGGVLENKQ